MPGGTERRAPARSTTVYSLVRRLLDCYQRWPAAAASDTDADTVATLLLAEAALRDLSALEQDPRRPYQVAVMGPTQAGKSTMVNLLCGVQLAPVSPLAGFTVHPYGFALAPSDPEFSWLDSFFPDWERCAPERLAPDRLDCYAVASVERAVRVSPELPDDCVVWDTPDFDSLKAQSYQRGVFEVAALADLIVLVLSKEKYADLSVWTTLRLLEPLRRPLLVCLNKVTKDAAVILDASLRQHIRELGSRRADTPVVMVPLHAELHTLPEDQLPSAVNMLRQGVAYALQRVDRGRRRGGVRELVQTYWERWIAPVSRELDAREAWGRAVQESVHEALGAYQTEFLNHPQRFDTFRRAVVELLQLLELPGLARSLTHVRNVLTWPGRQLMHVWRTRRQGRRRGQGVAHDLANEELVLQDLVEQLLTELSRDVARRCQGSGPALTFWRALNERLATDRAQLTATFHEAAHQHYVAFAPEIQEAASRLYGVLQDRPTLLNTLRATRVTADAAAVLLALKTGGIGVNDLLFAPALVSLTSMLTEGALGSYMKREADELKRRQYRAAEENVFLGVVQPVLTDLARTLDAPGLFGVSEAELRAAESSVEELGRG